MPRPSVRGKLVDAGYETLFSQGFQGSSIQDITEAAGVPKGSFFNHFKTKEALALEVLARYEEVGRGDLLFDETKPPLQRLRQHFEFLADRLEGWDFNRGCMIGNFATEMADTYPAIREALFDALTRWTDAIASVLRSAQAAGEIDPRQDADLLARFLVNSWEGAVIRLRVVRNRQPLDEFFTICFGALLK
ncbi:TetR/AcrR family transcriptional repressor of nem operon [Rhizobium sp. BK313]|jgi:TetR/AcrR family transcriptional repressor of nem operon|uniref:TetR/AcrR family transcriptional regulator n=1 Tax=Rhizobium sp. BK313 TaxID=2587081 RepID=UPI001060B85F|nr:TetR/AcrR family transcriptional regulator [Rhizobium sp. BK313]MBB3452270.1 TetR/AcrR family transcriptional repressor of nem operon [Rhizobium sp. BK313]